VAAVDEAEVQRAITQAVTEEAVALPQTTKPPIRVAEVVPVVARVTPQPAPVEPFSSEPRTVSRKSTSGRAWSVQLGAYGSKFEAEKALLKTALSNLGPLDGASRRISSVTVNGARLYRARFVDLSQADANKTCSRLRARSQTCVTVSPGS
jgi:D-alanyl-D-alanine carboxypeptidase